MGDSPFDIDAPWLQNNYQLDRRLIKAIAKLGFTYPTLVQAQTIPLALEGKDVLVRARTGSGKTLAFAIPLLQKILQSKENGSASLGVQCIVLAPTKELIKQIAKNITDLCYYCRDDITLITISDDQAITTFNMQSVPDILLATPAKLVAFLQSYKEALTLNTVSTFVLDEADLVLSYGYKDDIHKITSKMPKIFQGILVSATLSAELDKFKRLLLHKPVILKLQEAQAVSNLLQFFLDTVEEDKYLTLYVFLKLGILQVTSQFSPKPKTEIHLKLLLYVG
jgi:ATP-dependent RNA helicase DDX56/DBP9